jgi:hypothetical protein
VGGVSLVLEPGCFLLWCVGGCADPNAHRLPTMRTAHTIMALDEGKVAPMGEGLVGVGEGGSHIHSLQVGLCGGAPMCCALCATHTPLLHWTG